MRTLIWFIYFWLYLLCALPELYKARRLKKRGDIAGHDALVRRQVKKWASRLLKLAGAEIHVSGLENIPDGPCVFAANHQGYFDIPLLLSQLNQPHPMIAKKEIRKIPLVRDWMEELNCLFIDRENARQAMDCLKKAGELLAQGYSVIIFPEGTRSKGGDIGEFKGGTIRLATRAAVPIVPVCIEGTYKLMEKNNYWIKPAKVEVHVLPSVETAELSREEIKALGEHLRSVIEEKRNMLQERKE